MTLHFTKYESLIKVVTLLGVADMGIFSLIFFSLYLNVVFFGIVFIGRTVAVDIVIALYRCC